MNNAKTKSKTSPKKKAAAKGGQSNKKPAKAKSAAAAKSGQRKGPAATPKATAKVFRVDVNKGPIRQVSRADAIKDAVRNEAFSEDTLNAMLDRGEVIPSPDYFYATTEKALSKWSVDIAPESKPLEAGEFVFSADREVVGEVHEKDGGLRIFFIDPKRGGEKSVAVTAKWGRASEKQIEDYKAANALVKEEAAPVEVIPAMTDEERLELAGREEVIVTKIVGMSNDSMVIGENLDAIVSRQLWRESTNPETGAPYKNFGEYVQATFGITREYASNLVQIAGFHAIALEVAPAKLKDVGLSVNVTNALVRSLNKQTKELGLDEIEGFDGLRPIIVGTMKLLADVAPKNKRTGQPDITPRLVGALQDTIAEISRSGSVEIEGKQMSIADAAEKGVLGAATQAQVLEVVAEGIKANRQTIVDDAKSAYERAITPSPSRANGSTPGPKVFFSGTVPELAVSCDRHGSGDNTVITIGNGTFQTKCLCRWRIDHDTAKLVCFEVKGKRVKPATTE